MKRFLASVSAVLFSLFIAIALQVSSASPVAGGQGKGKPKPNPECQACKNACDAQLQSCINTCQDSVCAQTCFDTAQKCFMDCTVCLR